MSRKIVRGRFKEDIDKKVEEFLSGKDILYDTELIPYDIFGNIAHHLMLNKIGAISDEDVKQILTALKKIYDQWEKGKYELKQELEDVHMNIEQTVYEQIGPEIGGKMHLARSRNDQVLVDLRLFMRDEIINVQNELISLLSILIKKAEKNIETPYIGYTHTQQAQPITFAHWCMAHVDTLFRDLTRLLQTYQRMNMNPLGAAAIAGTSWPIDRQYTTELLGFDKLQENTLDVVSSRGEFEVDLISIFALLMLQIGRIAEDIILGATSEFGIIILSEKYSTGSSIMPQKKNPDVAELIRAKVGVMNGNLQKVLGILKGLPSGYNRDHQELKEALFSSVETVKLSITVLTGLISTMELDKAKIKDKLENNYVMATELADLLIQEWKIPFRTAYTIVANYIRDNSGKKKFDLEALTQFFDKTKPSNEKSISKDKIQKALDPLETVKRRSHIGGPAPIEEKRMIQDRKQELESIKGKVLEKKNKNEKIFKNLLSMID